MQEVMMVLKFLGIFLFLGWIHAFPIHADKVAFITGGASGIGAATVKKFVEQKVKVAFMDANHDLGTCFARQFNPEDVLFIEGNVTKVAEIRKAVQQTIEAFGHLDIVFANAGIYQSKNLLEMTEEDWQQVIDINLKGVVFTVKETMPHLIANGGGAVVLMASDQCFIGKPNSCAYGMSKGAIGQFAKSTAIDFGHKNIRVNAVCPATVRTPLSETAIAGWALQNHKDPEEIWELEATKYPLNRYGATAEVAELVWFLASEHASFITGALYLIDGGLTAH